MQPDNGLMTSWKHVAAWLNDNRVVFDRNVVFYWKTSSPNITFNRKRFSSFGDDNEDGRFILYDENTFYLFALAIQGTKILT